MKIAFLGRRDSIHLARWANAFARSGNEVYVLSAHPDRDLLDARVEMIVLPFRVPYGYFFNTLVLRRNLESISPDLLHVHFASGYGTLGSLSQIHPRILSVWGSDVYEFPDKSRVHQKLLTYNLNSADLICSTSHAMASRVRTFTDHDIRVVPFGIDTELFEPNKQDQEFFIIGTVRSLEYKYGVDLLIQAFSKLVASVDMNGDIVAKLRLIIVGDGPELSALKDLCSRLDLKDHVEFVGAIPHQMVPEYLNKMEIFVAPSRCEDSFGVSMLEASACELPVVVTNMGGLPEVVQDNITGLVVEDDNADDLVKALQTLVSDPDLRKRLAKSGRHRVIDHYAWENSVKMMEDVYQGIISG